MTKQEADVIGGLNMTDQISNEAYKQIMIAAQDENEVGDVLDKIRAEIEQLPTKTRTNWDGCCPDIDYPEIEYVDVSKNKLLSIIDKYKAESEDKNEVKGEQE